MLRRGASATRLIGLQVRVGDLQKRIAPGHAMPSPTLQQVANNVVRLNRSISLDVTQHRGSQSRARRGEHIATTLERVISHRVALGRGNAAALLKHAEHEVRAAWRGTNIS